MSKNLILKNSLNNILQHLEAHEWQQRIGRQRFKYKHSWRVGKTGMGCWEEPNVQITFAKSLYLGDYVGFHQGSVIICNGGNIELGFATTICRYSILQSLGGFIKIGSNSLVGDGVSLYGHGGLTIGDNVIISAGCRVIPVTKRINDTNILISKQGYDAKGIIIENNVWLGANCVILDGVTIGQGAIVGAGAVVTRDVPPYSVVKGIPARVTNFRGNKTATDEFLALEKEI